MSISKQHSQRLEFETSLPETDSLEQLATLGLTLSLSETDHLEQLAPLGVGTFGTVHLVAHSSPGSPLRFYAQKTMRKARLAELGHLAKVHTEARLLAECDHPFVARLHGVLENETSLQLLLEPALGGELYTLLSEAGSFPEPQAVLYAAMLVSALEHLHARRIAYGDLKPENILLDAVGYLKLVDFGSATRVDEDRGSQPCCGTLPYMAPCLVLCEPNGVGVDWWALGIVIYEMLVGRLPFSSDDDFVLRSQIVVGAVNYPAGWSAPTRDLVAELLRDTPGERLGCGPDGAAGVKCHRAFSAIEWSALVEKRIPTPWLPNLKYELDMSRFAMHLANVEDARFDDLGPSYYASSRSNNSRRSADCGDIEDAYCDS